MILRRATVPWFPGIEMEVPGQVMQLLQHITEISEGIGTCTHADMLLAIVDSVRLQHGPNCKCGSEQIDAAMADFYLHIAALLGMVNGIGWGGRDMGEWLEGKLTEAVGNVQ